MNFLANINNSNPSNDIEDAKKTMDNLIELSKLLRCDIDKHTLSVLMSLIENGTNPDHLANIVL